MDIEQTNATLAQLSKALYGDAAALQVVDPRELALLKQNARYFKKETFKQLVANVKKDKRLSSVPLCHRTDGGRLEVLSGNHRVKAAIEADIPHILIIVLAGDIARADRTAIQLSHNALVGLDDPQILADLWAQIDDIHARLYAGLSSDAMAELEKIELVSFTTPPVYTKSVTFAFTESEKEHLDQILTELSAAPAGDVHLAPSAQFEAFFALLQQVKQKHDIKNGSLAMLRLVELVTPLLKKEDA